MGQRAAPSGLSLSETDSAVVKGMLMRGDRQHDIAAWFGVNSGRVAEIASNKRFWWVAAQVRDLPPPGPFPTGRQAVKAQNALEKALCALAEAETALGKLTTTSARNNQAWPEGRRFIAAAFAFQAQEIIISRLGAPPTKDLYYVRQVQQNGHVYGVTLERYPQLIKPGRTAGLAMLPCLAGAGRLLVNLLFAPRKNTGA